jgi:hypothetical protein
MVVLGRPLIGKAVINKKAAQKFERLFFPYE